MKRLLIPIIALLLSTISFAQVGELRSNLAMGFNAGYNLSRADFSPTIKQELHPGLTGGATLRYTTEKYFSLVCAAQLKSILLNEDGENSSKMVVTTPTIAQQTISKSPSSLTLDGVKRRTKCSFLSMQAPR